MAKMNWSRDRDHRRAQASCRVEWDTERTFRRIEREAEALLIEPPKSNRELALKLYRKRQPSIDDINLMLSDAIRKPAQ